MCCRLITFLDKWTYHELNGLMEKIKQSVFKITWRFQAFKFQKVFKVLQK